MSQEPRTKRTINVIEAKEVHSGTGAKGEWKLYEITAVTPEGAPIDLKLKSFSKLSGTVEVEVEKQTHEKYGVSYMLHLPKGSAGARLGPKVDALADRVTELEQQVAFMRNQISSLTASQQTGAAPAPAGHPQPTPTGRFGGDDDIPF